MQFKEYEKTVELACGELNQYTDVIKDPNKFLDLVRENEFNFILTYFHYAQVMNKLASELLDVIDKYKKLGIKELYYYFNVYKDVRHNEYKTVISLLFEEVDEKVKTHYKDNIKLAPIDEVKEILTNQKSYFGETKLNAYFALLSLDE